MTETRCALHGQTSCPLCHEMPRQPREPEAHPFNMAIGPDGNPLPYSPADVRRVAQKSLDNGEMVCAIFQFPNGDLSVQIFGPPSHKLVEILEHAASQYRRVLDLHVAPPAGQA